MQERFKKIQHGKNRPKPTPHTPPPRITMGRGVKRGLKTAHFSLSPKRDTTPCMNNWQRYDRTELGWLAGRTRQRLVGDWRQPKRSWQPGLKAGWLVWLNGWLMECERRLGCVEQLFGWENTRTCWLQMLVRLMDRRRRWRHKCHIVFHSEENG